MKKIVSKVLVFTLLWTSLFSGGAQLSYAAPSTKTVIENDYTVDYEQGDYDILESEWQDAQIVDVNGTKSLSTTQNVEVYENGQWTQTVDQTITWSEDSTIDESQSYISDSLGNGWTDENGVQITFGEASAVPKTSTGQSTFTPTFQPSATNTLKTSTVTSGYADTVNFSSPAMLAASLQANTSAAPDEKTGWTKIEGTYYGYELGFNDNQLYEKYYQLINQAEERKYYNVVAKDTSPYEGKDGFSYTVVQKREVSYSKSTVPDTSKAPIGYEKKPQYVEGYEKKEYSEVKINIPATYKTVPEWVPAEIEIKKVWKPAVYKTVIKVIQPAIYGTRTHTVPATYKTEIVSAGYYKWVMDSKTGEPKQVWVAPVTRRVVDKPASSYTETYLISPEETKAVQELVTPGKYVDEPNIVKSGYYKDVRVIDKPAYDYWDVVTTIVYVPPTTIQVDDLTKPIYPTKEVTIEKVTYVNEYDIKYYEVTKEAGSTKIYKFFPVDSNTGVITPITLDPLQMKMPSNITGGYKVGSRYVGVTRDGYEFVVEVVKKGNEYILQADANFTHQGRLDALDCRFYSVEEWEALVKTYKEQVSLKKNDFKQGLLDGFTEDIRTLINLPSLVGNVTSELIEIMKDDAFLSELNDSIKVYFTGVLQDILNQMMNGKTVQQILLEYAEDVCFDILKGFISSLFEQSLAYTAGKVIGQAAFAVIGGLVFGGILKVLNTAIKQMIALGLNSIDDLKTGIKQFMKSNEFSKMLKLLDDERGSASVESLLGVSSKKLLDQSASKAMKDGFDEATMVVDKNQNLIDSAVNDIVEGTSKLGTTLTKQVKVVAKDTTVPQNLIETFADDVYETVETTEDILLYRVFGGDAKVDGGFATTSPGVSRTQVQNDLALLPEWGNDMTEEIVIRIPAGTKLNIGKVKQQICEATGEVFAGGADQVLLPYKWPQEWIVSRNPFN